MQGLWRFSGLAAMVPPMATLGDVARWAGVSAASVSRVLNYPEKVSPEIRERVMRAMGELGYVRDGAARALASRHSLTIGNVVPTLGTGIFAAGVAACKDAWRNSAISFWSLLATMTRQRKRGKSAL